MALMAAWRAAWMVPCDDTCGVVVLGGVGGSVDGVVGVLIHTSVLSSSSVTTRYWPVVCDTVVLQCAAETSACVQAAGSTHTRSPRTMKSISSSSAPPFFLLAFATRHACTTGSFAAAVMSASPSSSPSPSSSSSSSALLSSLLSCFALTILYPLLFFSSISFLQWASSFDSLGNVLVC